MIPYMGQLDFEGDLLRNGGDATQALFIKKFCKMHDRIFKTGLHQLYVNALGEIKRDGKTQVDWEQLTELRTSMKGISGRGYSAVMGWFVTALDDINGMEDSITISECKELLYLADEACGWRKDRIKVCSLKGEGDDGHRYALKKWEDVRNKLREVKNTLDEIGKRKFLTENNNFQDAWCKY